MFWRILLAAVMIPLFAQSQGGTDILLFDLKWKDSNYVLSNGVNITNRPGYDNQPFFHPQRLEVYYASAIDSTNVDIKIYDIATGETRQFTSTPENEFSPTVTPDAKFISCIIQRKDRKQDLGKFPIEGGASIVLINNLTVGYHVWAAPDKLLLFVLGDSLNTLRYYDLKSAKDEVIARNIGRSLHKIPGEKTTISFVQKDSSQRFIKRFDFKAKVVSGICKALPGREDICWTPDGVILMSDGVKLFSFRPGKDTQWKEVTIEGDVSKLKGVTRLAVNAAGNKLAMVITE